MIRTPLAYLQLCYLNRDLNQTILCHNTKLKAPKTMCKTRMFPKGRKIEINSHSHLRTIRHRSTVMNHTIKKDWTETNPIWKADKIDSSGKRIIRIDNDSKVIFLIVNSPKIVLMQSWWLTPYNCYGINGIRIGYMLFNLAVPPTL